LYNKASLAVEIWERGRCVPYQLSPDEKQHIDFFIGRVEELEKTPLMSRGTGLGMGLSVKYKIGEGMQLTRQEPDENNLKAALTTIRQFHLNKEPVFVKRISNICMKALKEKEKDPALEERAAKLRDLLEAERRKWKAAQRGEVAIKFNGKDISPEDAWDVWINGQYFHGDPEKKAILDSLWEPVGSFVRYNFLIFVQDTIIYAVNLRTILQVGLDDGLIRRSNEA
jgi:hypothetical protein